MSNATAEEAIQETSINSFVSAFVVNLLAGLAGFTAFSLIRCRFKHVYLSNFIVHTTRLFSELSETQVQIWNRLKPSTSIYSWLSPCFKTTDEEIFDLVGFDIFVYLRFIRLCLKFFAIILPYGLLVLLPLNINGTADLKGMSSLTMGNIELKSNMYWAHFVGVWIYSVIIYFLLYREWKTFTHYRQIYLRKGYEEQYSILVTDLPAYLRNNQNLDEFLKNVFPGKVISVHVFKAVPRWSELIDAHDDMIWKYEHAEALHQHSNQRPSHKKFILFGTKYDSITFYESRLKHLHDKMTCEQNLSHASLPTAAVTFKSLQDAAIGLQTCWNNSPVTSYVTQAPAPSDVIWENIGLVKYYRTIRYVIVAICLFFLVFFWSVPVLIVSSMVSLDALQKKFSFLEGVNRLPYIVKGFIEGFLATIVLEIFFAILPDLMAYLARVEGIVSRSGVAVSCIGKLFIFQIVNKFLGILFGGALLSRLHDIIDYPTRIPQILAESMPSMANFFVKVIMLRTFTGYPMEMLSLFRVLLVSIKRKWFCKTARENNEAWQPPPVRYPGMYANNLFVFIIGISYSVLSPVVLVFVVIYFGLAYVVRFYCLIYVRKTSFKAGGKMWPKVFNRMMIGIFVFQLLMVGVFGLKENHLVSLLCLPLPVLSFMFYKFIRNNFDRSTVHLNLSLAKEIKTPEKEFLKIASEKYNRIQLPEMFALSTDKKQQTNKDEPSEDAFKTPRTSLEAIELQAIHDRNQQGQQV
ncbi:CSC1-like protein ERD4 [Dendronephthya gigantea]|uniref:CSC1-like protein ERD4 n=1 Tax=Dendronephthya gigantea TaxID=151771 RepID=UPI00106922BD|nr:CSC1-like protein ERD4 [Dendronephthya gigantea]